MSMTTEEIIKIIEVLPEEKQREVCNFAEFIARKERRQHRRSNRKSAVSERGATIPQIIHVDYDEQSHTGETSFDTNARPIWETITELGQSIPAEEWSKIPTDLALNLEHYLYGDSSEDEV